MAELARLGLEVDANGGIRALKQFGNAADQASKQTTVLERTAGRLKGALGVLGAGAVLGGLAAKVMRESIDAQNALAQMEAAIASTGGAAGRSSSELQAFASAMQRTTTFGDDAVIAMQSLLLTFTKIAGPEFDAAQTAIADMATRMGGDLQGAAIMVGKALNDPILGVTALGRAGVQFSDSQKAMIKSLVDTGQVAAAQRIILGELETQFGGAAVAARDTLGGALAGLTNAWGDLFEVSVGASQGSVDAINAITRAMENNGISMNSLLTDWTVDWETMKSSIMKTHAIMSLPLGPSFLKEAREIIQRMDFDLSVKIADLRKAAKVGPGTTGGGGGGSGGGGSGGGSSDAARAAAQAARDAADARREVERAAKEAQQESERAAKTRADEADRARQDAEKAAEQYAKDLGNIWERGMTDIVASTRQGFRAMLDSVGGFLQTLMQRMAQEGQSSRGLGMAAAGFAGAGAGYSTGKSLYSTSHGAAGNYARGAVGGAASGAMTGAKIMEGIPGGPLVGAVVGALAGATGGLLGVSDAAKKAAKAMGDMQKSVRLSLDAALADAKGDTRGAAIARIKADSDAYRKQVEEAFQGGGAGSEQVRQRNVELGRINELEVLRIENLGKEAQALTAVSTASLNMVEGYKGMQALIFAAMPGREPSGTSPGWAGTGRIPGSSGGAGTSATSGDLSVTLVMPNGEVLAKTVLREFKRKAEDQYGDSTQWGQVQ